MVNNKGQFSIIAALLVAVVLVATVITTYSTIRYSLTQDQPQVLSAIDETNLALKQILGFTVGYYGSVLQVSGNSSYAKMLASNYLKGGLEYIADIKPEWGSSFNVTALDLNTNWFTNASYSEGQLNVTYNLVGLGVYSVRYSTSCRLDVQVSKSPLSGKACLSVFRDDNEPLVNLGKQDFKFYRYRYSNLTWEFAPPTGGITAFTNGTYLLDVPSGIDASNYVVQVGDKRGLTVSASSFNRIMSTLMFNTTSPIGGDYVDINTTDVDFSPNKGTQSNFTAQQYGPDNINDTLTEGVFGTVLQPYYPSNYNLVNSTSLVSGTIDYLQSDNGQYMQFRSYASAYSGAANFGQTSVGGSSSGLGGYARGNRFTCTTAGTASSISAYLSFTASSGTFGNTNAGTSGDTIVNTIRGQRFAPTATVVAQSIAAYLDVPAAPTLGNTAQESSYSSGTIEDTIRGSSFTASASGTIGSISAYVYRTGGSYNLNAAIYDEGTHTLLAQATAQSISSGSSQWVTFPFASPPSLTSGNSYVLVVWADTESFYSCYLYYYSSGSTNQGHSVSATYGGSFPSPASFTHNNYRYSIYCTYTQSANAKAAIYAGSSPATLIAATSPGTVTADGWATFTFPDPKPILTASTNYLLVVWVQSGSINVNLNYSSTTGGNGRYATSTYGDWPSSLTFSTNAYQYSIYCNYQTTAKAQCAIYSSTGSSRLGTTDEVILTASTGSWFTFPFTTKPVLSASTQYILAMMTDSSNVNFYYSSSGGEYYRASATYPTWPSTLSYYSSITASIYCTVQSASEYTCEVEFTGASNTQSWTQLVWTTDSACTDGGVTVTAQLWNFQAGRYALTGEDGYNSTTVGTTDVTITQTITSNLTNFRDGAGNWKLKFKGVKPTSSQFDMKIDLARYSPKVPNYALDIEEQWTNVDYNYTRQDLCIKTGALASENLIADVRSGSSWITILNPLLANQWNNISVAPYINSLNFTIRFTTGSGDVSDTTQDSWSIDAVLLRPQPDVDLLLSLGNSAATIELLQNGTMRWLGQNLQLTTQEIPIPPVPVKAIHVNQTIDGVNQEVPFQIEDWASNYRIPLGLTNNATVFGNRQMIVFLINVTVSKVTVWWNGSDQATQTPNAFTNRYFTGDDPGNSRLTNGKLVLQFGSSFTVSSTVGGASNTATFMRINNETSTYGSDLAYVIHHGIVRDVVQQEAEWGTSGSGGGAEGCPNVYANIVLTLPAKTTYYTYQLRLMFINSTQPRSITDLCPIKVSTSIAQLQTENGTVNGIPIVVNGTGTFSSNVWAHHWSQFISGTNGAGIMFTSLSNQQLYVFDSIPPGTPTGALKTNNSTKTIELLPVTLRQVQFTYALDVAWHGAVATFDATATPIYTTQGNSPAGLWLLAEYPPKIQVSTES